MAEMEYLPGGIRDRMEDLRNRRKLTLKEGSEKTGIDYSTLGAAVLHTFQRKIHRDPA